MANVTGDFSKGVVLPMARTLGDFRAQAGASLGAAARGGSTVKLYLNGRVPLTQPQQMALIKPGDVVVVKEEGAAFAEPQTPLSSHQAEFRGLQRQPDRRGVATPRARKQTFEAAPPGSRMQENSETRSRFITPVARCRDPLHHEGPDSIPTRPGGIGSSTYRSEFATSRNGVSGVTPASHANHLFTDAGPFDARSSYNSTFTRHMMIDNPSARPQPRPLRDHRLDARTENSANYLGTFAPKAASCKPNQNHLQDDPLQSSTEYKSTFTCDIEKDPRMMVRLEPEHRGARVVRGVQAPSPRSMPLTAR